MDLTFPETEKPELHFPESETEESLFPEVEEEAPVTAPGAPERKKSTAVVGPAVADWQQRVEKFTETPTFDKLLKEDESNKMSGLGFAANTLKSGGRMVRDIAKGVLTAPVAGVKSGVDLTNEINKNGKFSWIEAGANAFEELKKTGAHVADSLIEKYADEFLRRKGMKAGDQGGHGAWVRDPETGKMVKDNSSVLGAIGRRFYKDPVGTIADAAVVKDVVAAGGKLIGREVSNAGIAKAAREAEKFAGHLKPGPAQIEASLAAQETPNNLQRIGQKIQDVSSKVETIGGDTIQAGQDALSKLAFKGGNKLANADAPRSINAIGRAIEAMGSENPQLERKLKMIRGEEYSRAPAKEQEDLNALMPTYRNLSRSQRLAVGDVALMGEGASPEAWAIFQNTPNAQAAYAEYGNWIKMTREKGLSDLGVINPKIANQRVVLQYAKMKGWNLADKNMLKQAADEIAAMTVKPLYVPSGHELKGSFDLSASLGKVNDGTIGFLEAYKGQKGHSNDPLVFIPKAIKSFRKAEADMRYLRRITDDPEMVKAVTAGEALAQHGGKELQAGIHDDYLLSGPKQRAQAVYQRQLEKEYGAGAKDKLFNDPDVMNRWNEVSKIVADPTIKRILDMEFTNATGGARVALDVIDAINGGFRKLAVRLNPHYITGNAVGDALFSLMAGVSPKQIRLGNKLRSEGKMPYQALGTASVGNTGQTGLFQKWNNYVMDVDAAVRGGIIVKEVGKKLKNLGLSAKEFEKRAGEIMGSIERLSQGELGRVTAQENLAKRLGAAHKAKDRFGRSRAHDEYEAAFKDFKQRKALRKQYEDEMEKQKLNAEDLDRRRVSEKGVDEEGVDYEIEITDGITKDYVNSGVKGFQDKMDEAWDRIQKSPRINDAAIRSAKARLDKAQAKLDAETAKLGKSEKRIDRAYDKAADQSRLTELNRKDADTLRKAIALSNQWVGDYHGAGPVEQYLFRRVYPFLPFQKAMLGLSFKIAAVAPKEAAVLSRFAKMMEDQIQDDQNPTARKGYVPFGKNKKASIENLSPFEGTTIEGAVMPTSLDPRAHPVVSSLPGMQNRYRSPYGGQNVVGKNGRQYEPQPDGTMREVEGDRPLLEKVGNFAPALPRLERLVAQPLERAVLGKAYGVFTPVTDQKNPKGFLQRFGESMGLKIDDSNTQLQKTMEKLGPIDALKSEIKRLTMIANSKNILPEEKKEILAERQKRLQELQKFIKAGGKQSKE